MKDIQRTIELGDGESIICIWDPTVEIDERAGKFPGSVTYGFRVTLENGRKAKLAGGSRLFNALDDLNLKIPAVLKVSAHGDAGTTERDWSIEVVKQ